MQSEREKFTKTELFIMNNMRMLWEQHSAWTRMTIMSIVYELPSEEPVTNRLLRNPIDFARALKCFYGNKIASRFGRLLADHLVIAADLVKATIANDIKEAKEIEIIWFQNADEIAALLDYINPYWCLKEWKRMLYEHLEFVKAEADSLINGNYEESIIIYDKLESQALEMADEMSKGLIKQFPGSFK